MYIDSRKDWHACEIQTRSGDVGRGLVVVVLGSRAVAVDVSLPPPLLHAASASTLTTVPMTLAVFTVKIFAHRVMICRVNETDRYPIAG
jgi:hypothetical protein